MAKNKINQGKTIFFVFLLILVFVLIGGCVNNPSTPSPSAPSEKTILYSDNMSQWQDDWDDEYAGPEGKIFYSERALHIIDNNPHEWAITHTLNRNFNDFILDVDTKLINGTTNRCQGVEIRSPDTYNYYALMVCDGYYNIKKRVYGDLIVGKFINLDPPTRTSFIKKGIGAVNHIQIVADKDTISLSVNGNPVSTITDSSFREGNIGFEVCSFTPDSFSEVIFSNLTITTL